MRKLSPFTRDAILDATAKLLAAREFASLTTKEIAVAAGISEATLFRYFSKKDAILATIVNVKGAHFFGEIQEALELVDAPREKLLALLRQHARFACRFRDLITVCQREFSLCRKPGMPEALTRWLETLQDVLREGMRRAVFRRDLDLRATAMALHSVPHTLFLTERIYFRKPMKEDNFLESAELHYRLLLRAICLDKEAS